MDARVGIVAALLVGCVPLAADPPLLIPQPQSLEFEGEGWDLSRAGVVLEGASSGLLVSPAVAGRMLRERRRGNIVLSIATDLSGEAYRLSVDAGVQIEAGTDEGLYRGLTTLEQLLDGGDVVPVVVIEDGPRFSWRGSMVDIARHHFGLAELKRHVDAMALHKLNRLHVHLTDDQGWRIEILAYPSLTAIGGATEVGGGEGGFLTQAEWTELVAYAAERFVTVIPEIDMPGHVGAALASVPSLNADGVAIEPYTGTEVGWSSLCLSCPATGPFVEAVLGEVAALTPGPWLHIGGDEADATEAGEYRDFLQTVQGIVAEEGKTLIGWEEVAGADLAAPFVAQHWRRPEVAMEAAEQGAQLISSPADRAYLDMMVDITNPVGTLWAGLTNLEDAYTWDPQLGFPAGSVLGIEAPIWGETTAEWADVEFLVWPRLAGHAELGWSAAGDWDDYVPRLRHHARRLDALGIGFYRSPEIEW